MHIKQHSKIYLSGIYGCIGFGVLVFFLISMVGCTNANICYNKGEQFYAIGEYAEASSYFKQAYSRTPSKEKGLRAQRAYRLGDSYSKINLPSKSVVAYQNAVRNCEQEVKMKEKQILQSEKHKKMLENQKLAKQKAKAKLKAQAKARAASKAKAKAKAKAKRRALAEKMKNRKKNSKVVKNKAKKANDIVQPIENDANGEVADDVKNEVEEKTAAVVNEEVKKESNDSLVVLKKKSRRSRREEVDTIVPDTSSWKRLVYLKLGRQQLKLGNYKAAAENFRIYEQLDTLNRELLEAGLKSCELAPQWKAEPNAYIVKRENQFNSNRSDFSPMLLGDESDQLIITSTRSQAQGDDVSGVTGVKFADMFTTRKDERKKWKPIEEMESDVNTEYEDGVSCLSHDGKTMYFTRCSHDPSYPRNAEIYKSTRSDASWGTPTRCDISRDTLCSYAHPAASPDGNWLYFTSNMPGGMGGFDIWRVQLLSEGFGDIENLGAPINTPGDEMFPSFRPNGDLYFSSDGHEGMGGLDIFLAKYDSIKGWNVQNQQYPLNSPMDDFGMTFDGLHNRGFFSSSRNDGKGWEHIYSFELPEIIQTVTGWVYEKDGYELPEGQVHLVGDDGTNERLILKDDGSFQMEMKPGVKYIFLGICKGYLNIKNDLFLPKTEAGESHEFVLQFPLPPLNIPVVIDNIFYEFDKATLTPESANALDSLVTMMENNPHITIELAAHCDYRGNDEYNLKLSQKRAEAVVDYLIQHGVKKDRLTPVGYGETRPKIIRRKVAEKYPFLHEGDTLTEEFIINLQEEEAQEICNLLNRRTEFKVLRTTYGMSLKDTVSSDAAKKEED